MLLHRLFFGVLMIGAALGVLILDNGFAPFFPITMLAGAFLVWVSAGELCLLLNNLPLRVRHRRFVQLGCLAIALANWLPMIWPRAFAPHEPNLLPAFYVFVAIVMTSFIREIWDYRQPGHATMAIGGNLLAFFYVGLLASFVFQIRWLGDRPQTGAAALALLIFTTKGCDIGAFFAGRFLGRRQFAPNLSPAKTIEGAIGGLVAAMLIAVSLAGPLEPGSRSLLSWPLALAFGLVVGLFAQLGDLLESLLKRDCGQKDAATSIPGFGGLLDVVDSVLFAAPVAYLLLRAAGLPNGSY